MYVKHLGQWLPSTGSHMDVSKIASVNLKSFDPCKLQSSSQGTLKISIFADCRFFYFPQKMKTKDSIIWSSSFLFLALQEYFSTSWIQVYFPKRKMLTWNIKKKKNPPWKPFATKNLHKMKKCDCWISKIEKESSNASHANYYYRKDKQYKEYYFNITNIGLNLLKNRKKSKQNQCSIRERSQDSSK